MKCFSLLASRSVAAALLTGAATMAYAQDIVDWTSGSSGSLPGATVTFSGGSRSLISDGAWVTTVFNLANMTAPVGITEGIEFSAASSGSTLYSVSFSSPVSGVMLHIGSLASTLTFDRAVSKLSGQSNFEVNGNSVVGSTVNSGQFSDANGSVYLGDLQSFSFTVSPYAPSGEGIGLQIVTGAVPEPAAWAMMIAGLFGVGAYVRRRASL
jgi:hypothetical protein